MAIYAVRWKLPTLQMVFPSPRYSLDGLGRLLINDLKCKTILTTHKSLPIVPELLAHHPLNLVECPSVAEFLDIRL